MNRLEDYLLSVSRGRRGVIPALLRGTTALLAPVYVAGLRTYLLPYAIGLRKRAHLPCPVISIGNITAGGTGKTPMTQMLCRLLTAAGYRVAVLIRGYSGEREHDGAVVSDGRAVLLSVAEAGDEAFLLAHSLPGVPVIAGKDRRRTGRLACREFQPDILLLDDGLQYWQLHRDLDIVLLNATCPFDNGHTFPRGLLREPPAHLRRAGVIILTRAREVSASALQALQQQVRQLAPGCPILTADLIPVGLHTVSDHNEYPLSWLDGRRVAAFSAIGHPASFESMIGELGGILAARFRLRDHRRVTAPELEQMLSRACSAGAEALITTEKDAVKMPRVSASLPVLALQVTMQVEGVHELLARIEGVVRP
ncbi:MAG: tetraacyldisaccharide 4'-kinase [Chloroherpetonaceae bacterium]|nr:tetraacyldisaccharide 4'-kinase [Chthonomonadaceae bacterium]MDW8207344.1 tetraacyldisaccharide 4'-kinase [Chloroherpetonaceae bacterium]